MPEEFQQKLDDFPDLEKAFKALTPGREDIYFIFLNPNKSKLVKQELRSVCH